ncbi:MAG: hypothetical protein JXR37_11965 [Kiritimatiellae bacterium]|nr:hypothetical protein [Kiritimatiellia bacterium]
MQVTIERWVRVMAAGLFVLTMAAAVRAADNPAPPRKHAAAARLEGQIVVDGKLDDKAWAAAPEHTGFAAPLGMSSRKEIPPECQTFFRVLYDEAALYFGIRCNEPRMDRLVTQAAKKQHDAAMWSDDDIEIFLDPVGDRNEYYQFAINTDGTQVDAYLIEKGNTGKGGWSSDWQAEVFKGTNFWSLEVRFPFGVFHNRASSTWAQNWVFSIARTRKPSPSYFSQFSPVAKGGYHDVDHFGTLGPIAIDRTQYNLFADSPVFRLEPAEGGYRVFASLQFENRGKTGYEGTLDMNVLAPKSRGASAAVRLEPESSARIELPAAFVVEEGKFPVLFKLGTASRETLALRADQWLRYTPLAVKLTEPNYRNCIYPTEKIDAIQGVVTLGMPLEQVTNGILRVTLSSSLHRARHVDREIAGREIGFDLEAADLPVGRHLIRCEILRPRPGAKDDAHDRVAEREIVLRKLAPAPGVEARIDEQGNLLVDGHCVFPRGWYASMSYVVSRADLPRAKLPRTTNFMMAADEREQFDSGLYTLAHATRGIDESKAKLDQPIDGELKARLRRTIAGVRNNTRIIGYYISDEPECRGLSPYFLQSLYEFLAEEDPYRFCMIVSRAPAEYMQACDVMCPHPYMSPHEIEDGTRRFGAHVRAIHANITKACAANDGSKAVWCMPQTFSYGDSSQNPTFRESRWFTHTAIACGAKGIVPFLFCGYRNHFENWVAMNCVFEELTYLAPAWTRRDSATAVTADNPALDVIAKRDPRKDHSGSVFLVAANQSYERQTAVIEAPELARIKARRLVVLREDRLVEVEDGRFTDTFEALGVHLYTTSEVVPFMKTLDTIEAEIRAGLGRADEGGNLLGPSARIAWRTPENERNFRAQRALADGVVDAAGWLPVYGDRSQCAISFAEPVSFSRVVFYSPTIRDAALDIWADGGWKTLHEWKDQFLHRIEYEGPAVTTDKLRIKPTAARGGGLYEITEMGVYP